MAEKKTALGTGARADDEPNESELAVKAAAAQERKATKAGARKSATDKETQ